jgi:hypothetical protein
MIEEHILKAIHGSSEHPLRIGDITLPCYVLEDGKRVLVLQGMLKALQMAQGTASKSLPGNRLAKFIGGKSLQSFVPSELVEKITNPIHFRSPSGGMMEGYEATILPDICEAVLKAQEENKLNYQQKHVAKRCEILIRGFARVGIIALIDEATGYQSVRARQALEEILEKFISQEMLKWSKTFPDAFYEELFRLKKWQYSPLSVKRPRVIGTLTNDIVYERLAPGVLDALKIVTPKDEKGRRKHTYHQHLTQDEGRARLREHLASVITLMKASPTWQIFERLIERALPKYDTIAVQLHFNNWEIGDD